MTSAEPARPRATTRRSTRGAKILTAMGALLCIGAVVLGVATARQFVWLLPLDVLGSGSPSRPTTSA